MKKKRAKYRPAVTKKCEYCGVSYRCKASHADKSHFCSRQCYADSQRTLPRPDPRPCEFCGTIFKPSRKMGHARFCSKSCAMKSRLRDDPDYNSRIARESAAQRGDKLRGSGKLPHTYVKRDGRHEHRVVAENKLGRALRRGEVVHHIDGNPKNNDPSNLMIITQRQHMLEHGLGVPGITPKHRPWEKRRKGQDDACAKICDADVVRIREMYLFGAKQQDIANVFELDQSHVSAIVRRVRWSHVS